MTDVFVRFRGNSFITTSATRPCFLLSDYVQRAKKVLGLGLILMMPAIRTTNSNLAWQLCGNEFSPSKKEKHRPKSHPSFGGFQPLGQGGIPPFNPRLRLHEEVAVHLGLSAQLHQLCGTVGVLLGEKKTPRSWLGICLISDPFPQNFPNNKKTPKHQQSRFSALLKWDEWNTSWGMMNNDAITSDPTWTLQVHKVVWYQAVLLVGRSPLLQLSTFFLFKLLARWQQILHGRFRLLDLCKESGSKNNTKLPSRNKLMTCAIGHIPTKTSGSGCASLVFCFAANACFFSSKICVTFTTKTNSCPLAEHIWDPGTTSDSIKWKGPTHRCPKNHLYKLIFQKKITKNLQKSPISYHIFGSHPDIDQTNFCPPGDPLPTLHLSLASASPTRVLQLPRWPPPGYVTVCLEL